MTLSESVQHPARDSALFQPCPCPYPASAHQQAGRQCIKPLLRTCHIGQQSSFSRLSAPGRIRNPASSISCWFLHKPQNCGTVSIDRLCSRKHVPVACQTLEPLWMSRCPAFVLGFLIVHDRSITLPAHAFSHLLRLTIFHPEAVRRRIAQDGTTAVRPSACPDYRSSNDDRIIEKHQPSLRPLAVLIALLRIIRPLRLSHAPRRFPFFRGVRGRLPLR
ncbi:hypothetical protein CALVIDRAFT_29099 [Calocera viscosa TUFC12733]|uniref:Uncharacterized protein n=1 Tax=Calocera viscosa (strain TUFC12733) TaxID=1330018 RepID=A0A167PAR4_CALVF|nr:hypothetical protein CALVIDRAFT_29099 [Calocera viscosa TUFC12733]